MLSELVGALPPSLATSLTEMTLASSSSAEEKVISPCATTTIFFSFLSLNHLLTHLARSSTFSGAKKPCLDVQLAPLWCAGESERGVKSRPENSGSDSRKERS
ncbi:hypothetical protein RTBOTA2_006604 [Rhodotorula toruloides]|nr:hypothetical protein RTBOTA2_006604 [Rhodotorula toruloides]